MKFLLSWLKDYVELSLPPEALARELTLAGLEVKTFKRVEQDWLFEAEVTPNRPDLLSHLGIAREAAAVLGRTFRLPKRIQKTWAPLKPQAEGIPVSIEDSEDCSRYLGIVIEGVKVGPSSERLVKRLARLGVKRVNNVVDVTNAVLMELGQPLHAFDLDRLEGPEIRVRRARAGECLTTLDGVRRELKPETLVIADAKRPVALAGVMGGKETEITEGTRRVLLESARFHPLRVRRAVRQTKLASDSSYRFERGVDPAMVSAAAMRAARWIEQVAGGKVSALTDRNSGGAAARRSILLKPQRVQRVLGARIAPAQQKRILERLGCRVRRSARGFRVEPPVFRRDLRIAEDLCEELARLWGYERAEPTLPPMERQVLAESWRPLEPVSVGRQAQARTLLAGAGLQEIQTYSLLSGELLERCRLRGIEIQNPLSAEQAWLRPSLLPGALETVSLNLRRKSADRLALFELGTRFDPARSAAGPRGDGERVHPAEEQALGLMLGDPSARDGGILRLKGYLERLFDRLGSPISADAGKGPAFLVGEAICFRRKEELLGFAGRVDPEVAAAFDVPAEFPLFFAELRMEGVLQEVPPAVRVRPLPKVPAVERDLAVVVPESVPYARMEEVIRKAGKPLLVDVRLFDLYRGKQIETGKKSLAFRLVFSGGDRTLKDAEVCAAFGGIFRELESQLQATLRQ